MIDVYLQVSYRGVPSSALKKQRLCVWFRQVLTLAFANKQTTTDQMADAANPLRLPPYGRRMRRFCSTERVNVKSRELRSRFYSVCGGLLVVSIWLTPLATYLDDHPRHLTRYSNFPCNERKEGKCVRFTPWTGPRCNSVQQSVLLTFRGRLLRMHSASNTWPTVTPSITAAAAPHNHGMRTTTYFNVMFLDRARPPYIWLDVFTEE